MALIKKIRKVGTSMMITLPKSIADLLGWEVNDKIEIELDENNNTAIKIKKTD